MIPYNEALAIIENTAIKNVIKDSIIVNTNNSLGMVSMNTYLSTIESPNYRNSAMDGFALANISSYNKHKSLKIKMLKFRG